MTVDDWIKLAAFLVTLVGGGGGVATAFKWILQPYKDALIKAEAQSSTLLLQITNKQAIIDELVESHMECEIEHSEKDAWIGSAHAWITSATTWMKNRGAELPEIGEPPPKRERKAIARANYLQKQSAQNTANVVAITAGDSSAQPKPKAN